MGGGGGSKIVQNCVTSFMDDPSEFQLQLDQLSVREFVVPLDIMA
jgi:hypothetical protein